MTRKKRDRNRDSCRMLRREKVDPCADFWHTLQIGLPIAALLFLLSMISPLMNLLRQIF